MKNILKNIGDFTIAACSFLSKHYLEAQSLVLWILAFFNLGSAFFWVFAIPAIVLSGMSDIVIELRKLNLKDNGKQKDN
jgi:hypothetical protein